MTFFIYSKFADSFSRSWFLSSLKNRIKSNEFIINDKENNYNEREVYIHHPSHASLSLSGLRQESNNGMA